MGYNRYTKEKAAQAKRKANFAKKQEQKKVKRQIIKDEDEDMVPHPSAPRAFIIKKKPNA